MIVGSTQPVEMVVPLELDLLIIGQMIALELDRVPPDAIHCQAGAIDGMAGAFSRHPVEGLHGETDRTPHGDGIVEHIEAGFDSPYRQNGGELASVGACLPRQGYDSQRDDIRRHAIGAAKTVREWIQRPVLRVAHLKM